MEVKTKAMKSVPSIDFSQNIRNFAGLRAKRDVGFDFVVGEDEKIARFYHMAAMASPGLSSAYPIALDILSLLQKENFYIEKKEDAVQTRTVTRFADLNHEQRKAWIQKHPSYGHIVCRCEGVSEGEIREAMHHAPIPKSLDAIKRRCNAGMGRCQGGFCGPIILKIMAEELHCKPEDILQDKQGSYILWKARDAS